MTEFVRVSLLFGRTGIFEIQQIRERKGNARVQERVLGRPARYAAPLSSKSEANQEPLRSEGNIGTLTTRAQYRTTGKAKNLQSIGVPPTCSPRKIKLTGEDEKDKQGGRRRSDRSYQPDTRAATKMKKNGPKSLFGHPMTRAQL